MLTLYGSTGRSFRCAWMLEEIGVPWQVVPLDFATGETHSETAVAKKVMDYYLGDILGLFEIEEPGCSGSGCVGCSTSRHVHRQPARGGFSGWSECEDAVLRAAQGSGRDRRVGQRQRGRSTGPAHLRQPR